MLNSSHCFVLFCCWFLNCPTLLFYHNHKYNSIKFYLNQVHFINFCTINCMQDNLQLYGVCGKTDGFCARARILRTPVRNITGIMARKTCHYKPIKHQEQDNWKLWRNGRWSRHTEISWDYIHTNGNCPID